MKKLIFCTALLIFLATNINVSWSKAETNETYFAKVANEGVFFYSLPIKSDSCKMFEIPASYFVLLTGKENEFFYRAKYSDVEGFVPISSVEPIEETPNYPFAMSSFRVFLASDLYSQPNQKSSLISTIEPLTISSTYYGKISGEEVLPSSTNVWYYASFFDGTKTVRG